jgi:non-specific protein-tyrosine kinase
MHWAWLLILSTVLAGGIAYFLSKRATPVYQAVTILLVNEAPATTTNDYTSVLTSERLAKTYEELIQTFPVLEETIANLKLDITPEDLQQLVIVELIRDTQLIDVRVEDTDPERAAAIANELVQVFSAQNQAMQAERYASSKANLAAKIEQMTEQVAILSAELDALEDTPENQNERTRIDEALGQYREIYASFLTSFEKVRVAESSTVSTVTQVEVATPPLRPIRPRVLFNTFVAGILGLFIAAGVAFALEALDDTLSPDDVVTELGLPVLGVVAHHPKEGGQLIVAFQPRSPVSEAFRSLRTNLQFASVNHPLRSLMVTSPSPQDGKSTVAANLGVVMAQGGRKVVLVEADLRRPQVHKKLGIPNRLGISSIIVQPKVVLDGTIQETSIQNLSALTSGDLPPNPAELIGSEKMNDILHLVGGLYDMVIIDTPPVMAVTDASALATKVDGVLVVIKPGATKLAACKQTIEQLKHVGANILGVVLNDVEVNRSRYKYGHYKGYYYSHNKYYHTDSDNTPSISHD